MKLDDYLTEFGMAIGPVNKTPSHYMIEHEDVEGKHVIGECGDCEYKRNYGAGNVCKHPEESFIEDGFPDSYGCIHFKGKE